MKFLYPELLYGWLALIIPVLIHLFNFRKFKKVYFTKVSYLQNIQEQTASFQKIKNYLLLFSRLFFVFFLVLAFAQPYYTSNNSLVNSNDIVVSIYIDNSHSMSLQNEEGDLLHQAKNKAIEIAKLYPLNTKFQLLTNDFSGEQQTLLDKENFVNIVSLLKIGLYQKEYQKILNRQISAISEMPNARKDIFIISDFQKQKPEFITNNNQLYHVYLIPLKATYVNNISIDTAYFINAIHKNNSEQKLVYKVFNRGNKDVKNIPVELFINEQAKGFKNVTIKTNSFVTDTIIFNNRNIGWQKGLIHLKDYPMVFDDTLRVAYEMKSKIDVLVLYDNELNKYINAAYKSDDFFNVVGVNQNQINYSSLNQFPIIICSNLKNISQSLAQQLKKYVQNGGILSVFIPINANIISYQKGLQLFPADYPIQLNDSYLSGGKLAINNSFFKGVFDGFSKNIDLPNASKSWLLSNSNTIAKQNLIISQNQANWFSYYPINKGGLYLSAIPLEPEFSNLTKHALFIPLLYQMALSSGKPNQLYEIIGAEAEINIPNFKPKTEQLIYLKNKYVSYVAEPSLTTNGFTVNFADQIKSADFYTLAEKNIDLSIVAFNHNRSESDLKYYSKKELKQLFYAYKPYIFKPNLAALSSKLKVSGLDSTLWKVCLILAFLFLLSEILLIRFYKPKI